MKGIKGLIFLIVFIILVNFSCQKEEIFPSTVYEEVTLKNLTGFDGCGFVFQKTDSTYLEPTNLGHCLDTYIDGKNYLIKYKRAKNQVSICQVGLMIEIVEIVDRLK